MSNKTQKTKRRLLLIQLSEGSVELTVAYGVETGTNAVK